MRNWDSNFHHHFTALFRVCLLLIKKFMIYP